MKKSPTSLDLKKGRITVYGKSWCPYCRVAKQLLRKKDKYINITKKKHAMLDKATHGAKSIPMVFQGTKYIGGLSQLNEVLTLPTSPSTMNLALKHAWKHMSTSYSTR